MKLSKKFYFSILSLGLIGLFGATYYITSKGIQNRELDKQKESVTEVSSTTGGRSLKEDLIVSFYTGESRDKTTTVKEIMKQSNITSGLTEEELSKSALKDGYELVEKSNDRFIYKRNKENSKKTSLEPNMYYIGESDGYLAIYKADKDGNLSLEKVYSDDTPIDMFRDGDVNKIKNYTYFSSKNLEEVENKITELTT